MHETRTAPAYDHFAAPGSDDKSIAPLTPRPDFFAPLDTFLRRHLGPGQEEIAEMLRTLGYESLDALTAEVIPPAIQFKGELDLPAALGETAALEKLRVMMDQNKVHKSYLGQGYYGTITPPVIQRNILENPGWYTAYTPLPGGKLRRGAWRRSLISRPWSPT